MMLVMLNNIIVWHESATFYCFIIDTHINEHRFLLLVINVNRDCNMRNKTTEKLCI